MSANIHEMTDEELNKQLDSARKELLDLRFSYATARSLQSPARVGQLRKTIARCLTVQTARKKGLTITGKGGSKKQAAGKK
ncbi:MAG: 50S ribosomal protein L29 [bacterium]|nr:50S ribosomal protein L29 [bacterium]